MIGQSAGKSFAYLLGVYLGDGCVTMQLDSKIGRRYPCFRLNTIDLDFAEAVKAALEELTDRPVSIHTHSVSKSSKPNHALRCGDPDICATLLADTEGKQHIPAYVWEWPRVNKLAFISGLMDSEGFVSKKHGSESTYYMGFKCCEPWVRDFARLMESCGVMIGKVVDCKPYKDGYRSPTRFHVKVESWVRAGCSFNIERKNARVRAWIGQRLAPETNTQDAPRKAA